jgi:hypothetical protein
MTADESSGIEAPKGIAIRRFEKRVTGAKGSSALHNLCLPFRTAGKNRWSLIRPGDGEQSAAAVLVDVYDRGRGKAFEVRAAGGGAGAELEVGELLCEADGVQGGADASAAAICHNSSMDTSLCETCRHLREVVTPKGSRFLLCQRSVSDQRFPRYPPQPVVRCGSYERRGGRMRSLPCTRRTLLSLVHG